MTKEGKENQQEVEVRKIIYTLKTKDLNGAKGMVNYLKIFKSVWNYVFDNYKRKENYVRVEFSKNFVVMKVYEFLMHLIFWRVLIVFRQKITENDLYRYPVIGLDETALIMDKIIKSLLDKDFDSDIISKQISYTIDDLCKLGSAYSYISGDTLSLFDFIEFMGRDKEFKKCVNTVLDESKPIKEIEAEIEYGTRKLNTLITKDKKTCLYSYLKSGQMKKAQMTQTFFAVGPRANADKTILPKIVTRNFLRGFQNLSEYYVDAISARNALIMKRLDISDSGYFSRKINLFCLNTQLDGNCEDCGTPNYMTIHVSNADILKSLDTKNRILDNGKLKPIVPEIDTDLIGKTIKIRSVAYCSHHDGLVCAACYGSRTKRVNGTVIGILPSIKIANTFSNLNMKAKHFQTTDSIEIENEAIKTFFTVEGNSVFFNDDLSPKDIFLELDREEIEDMIEFSSISGQDDEIPEILTPLKTLTLADRRNSEGSVYNLSEPNYYITFNEAVMSKTKKFGMDLDSDKIIIALKDLNLDEPIFNLTLITNETSRYMHRITNMVDSSLTNTMTPNEMYQDFLETLAQSKVVKIYSVHFEIMLYNMIRDPHKKYLRPDFKKKDPPIKMLSMKQALLKKDLWTGLSYENIKSQLVDVDTFEKTNGGIFDGLFRTTKPSHLIPIPKALLINNIKNANKA